MPAERALLTGGAGFVGRQVIAPLAAAGFEVHAPTRGECDLLAPGQAAALVARLRPALLVHCAWEVTHGRFWHAPENTAWLAASTDLIDAFFAAGGQRCVGVGSCAEYDWREPGEAPWPETRPLAPATPYGAAKLALFRRFEGRSGFAWARLFHLFGPGEAPGRFIPGIIAALRAGRTAECASGRPIRDVASSWFVGRALAALAAAPTTGAINIASGQGIALGALAQKLGTLLGRPELVALGRRPDPPDEPPSMFADTTRLRHEVGFAEAADLDADLARLVKASPNRACAPAAETPRPAPPDPLA